MGLLTAELEIEIQSSNVNYYEKLGYTIPRRYDKKNKKFSYKKGTIVIIKAEDLPATSKVKVDVQCDHCGEIYSVYYFNYLRSQKYHEGKVYCNHCIQKVFKKKIKEVERDRRKVYPEYTTFVRNVLKRDNYTCQCCQKKSTKDLEVHHLDSYDWCVEKRLEETNAITLCKNCHGNFHSKYGRGNNHKEQYEEWIGYCITLINNDEELETARKIYCYEEKKIYKNAEEFAQEHQLKSSAAIYKVCNNMPYYLTVRGLHIFWYDEFCSFTEQQLETRVSRKKLRPSSRPVVLLETGEKFNSIKEASQATGANSEVVRLCCHHRAHYAKLKNGMRGHWMFYNEYVEKEKFRKEIEYEC